MKKYLMGVFFVVAGSLPILAFGASGEDAIFDPALGVPHCTQGLPGCYANPALIQSRDNIPPTPEPNSPNTLYNSCPDGSLVIGGYGVDESVEGIFINTVGSEPLSSGSDVIINFQVICSPFFFPDWIQVYWVPDVSNPSWQLIGIDYCPAPGPYSSFVPFTLPGAGTQAIRVGIEPFTGQDPMFCSLAEFSDWDEVAFAVGAGGCPDNDGDGRKDSSCGGNDCDDENINTWNTCATCVDGDLDTYYQLCNQYITINGPDCDDDDDAVYPGAPEICDGQDNQCLGDPGYGQVDEDCDADGDGLPDSWENTYDCMMANTVDNTADYDSDGLDNDGEYAEDTDPCDADTDNDGATDGYEVNTSLTDPLDPDSDDDLMFDGWEITGASCGLNPLVGDSLLDGDTDGLENIHEYFNNNGDGNVNDPCDPDKPRQGWPGGGYFGDGDGNLLIGVPDMNRINLILNGRSADYSNAFPADQIIQDMDGNLIIGVPDKNLISLILNGKLGGIIAGSPTELSLVAPIGGATVAEGDTVRIQVKLTKDLTKPRAGFGVVFTIVSGAGTLLGGEGISGSGRYDLTALDGVAQMVVMVTGAGLIEVKVELPSDSEVHTGQVNMANVEINGESACSDGDEDSYDDDACGGDDCDDFNPDIFPGAPEICFDGVDNQCPGDPGYGFLDEFCICTSMTTSCWSTPITGMTLTCTPTSNCSWITTIIHTFSSYTYPWTTCIPVGPGSSCWSTPHTTWTYTCSTHTNTYGCTYTAALTLFPSPTKMALNESLPGSDHWIATSVAQAIDKLLMPGPLAAAEDQNTIPAGGRRRAAAFAGNIVPLSYGTLAVEEQWIRGRYDDTTNSWGLGDEVIPFLSVSGPGLDYQVAALDSTPESRPATVVTEPEPAPEEQNVEITTGKFQAKFSFMAVKRPH